MKVENMLFLTQAQKEILTAKNIKVIRSLTVVRLLEELMKTKFARTGYSGFSNGHGVVKDFTEEVKDLAKILGLNVVQGNDAPRGGIGGKHLKLVS